MRKEQYPVEKIRQFPHTTSAVRPGFVVFVVFFLLASLLTQANAFAPAGVEPLPMTPPSEISLGQFGQWETEYWDDSGRLAFNYVGDPNPVPKQPEGFVLQADFSISKPTLLTAIVDVHFNPNVNATHVENNSPGSLALVDDVGNYYGPFAAETTSAVNNGQASATMLWVASVDNVELPPGHYLVIDSDTTSVLFNAQTQGVPATFVKGVDAEAYASYMDGLVAANEPEPVGQPVATATAGNPGVEPVKVTYSNPQALVNNPPDTTLSSFPSNYPSLPCEFVTDKPVMVTKVMDYHINNGKGAHPGMIGLQEHGGTSYGSWPAYGQAYNGIPNAIWVVSPNFEIPAGSYKVIDNEFSTLSADANNRAMCEVKASPVVTSPVDNVTGKYIIGFSGDDGIAIDFNLVLAIIDHKNTVEIGTIVEGQPLKFNAAVTGRNKGVVTARFSQGFSDFSIVVRMTFTKKADKYVLTGRVIGQGTESAGVDFSGSRTSTDLPGFVPQPHAGIGKVGSIPGPGSEAQAVAGIAFPTLATLIAAAAASGGGGGRSAGSGLGTYGGEAGGGEGGETVEGGGGEAVEGDGSETGEGGGEAVESGSGEAGGDTGSPGTSVPDTGVPVQSQPPPVAAPPAQNGPQDGQTMTVHDSGDGLDKTYEYHGDSGQWINPLTGGAYIAANYAASAQAKAETDAEIKKRAEADANALADGLTKWIPGSADSTIVSPRTPAAATVIPAAAGAVSAASTAPPVPADTGKVPAPVTSTVKQGPPPMIRQGIIDLKTDLDVIDKNLKDQGFYVMNKFQGDPSLIFETLEEAGNTVWNYTGGWVTGSKGITCQGYVNKTRDGVIAAVNKQFPGAKVDRVDFEERSTLFPDESVSNWLDSWNKDNHQFMRVTLPDGSQWAIDFHGHNASNLPKNPPIMRPYEEVRREWKTYMGDEFQENFNVKLDIADKK
jgi:hypothetical protein